MGATHSFLSSKRPRPEDYAVDDSNEPVKKKLKTTEYIYDRLFQNGENSDISITALGKEWNLHKIYLSQSPYFQSMFEGGWKESAENAIQLNIPDENITSESLDAVFGSLYRDDIMIDANHCISLVAAASILQLEPVISQCVDVMKNSLNAKNVVEYHMAAQKYSLEILEQGCFEWLERNVMFCSSHNVLLQSIGPDLMKDLILSPNLFVLQGELDIYSMLKKWLYLCSNPIDNDDESTPTSASVKKAAEEYFAASFKKKGKYYLETNDGKECKPVFEALKLADVLTTPQSVNLVQNDKVIPKNVLNKCMVNLWKLLLTVEDDYDNPEPNDVMMDVSTFSRLSQRCGRILQADSPYCWRWTGYNFGVDILVSYKQRIISIKRNCSSQACPYSVNMKLERLLTYRLLLANFSPDRKLVWYQDSGIKSVKLAMDQSVIIARIPRSVEFPLTVLLNHIPTVVHENFDPWA